MKNANLYKLLTDLLYIYSPSEKEEDVIKYVQNFCSKIPNVKVKVDTIGNMYITRGKAKKYPLLNAHMDCIETISSKYIETFEENKKEEKVAITKKPKEEKTSERTCKNCEEYDLCYINGEIYYQNYLDYSTNMARYCTDFKLKQEEKKEEKSTIRSYFQNNNNYAHKDCGYSGYRYTGYTQTSYNFRTASKEATQKAKDNLSKDYVLTLDETTGRLESNGLRVMGGDDKCGVAMALYMLSDTDVPLKIFLSVQEEIGCVGAKHALKNRASWFNDVKYMITMDRRGSDNLLLKSAGDYNGKSLMFFGTLAYYGFAAGIEVDTSQTGSSADCCVLREIIDNTVNISVGYYNPHTTSEYIDYNAFCRSYDWVKYTLKGM